MGFAISPGFETFVSMRYTQLHRLPEPYPSKCAQTDLKYYEIYTRQACLEECLTDAGVEKCGCRRYTHPGTARECDPLELVNCSEPFLQSIISSANELCTCPVPCEQSVFEPKVSTAFWPAVHILKEIEEAYNVTDAEDIVRRDFLDVWFYFEELSFEEITQEEAYTQSSLLSDTGGFMGLLLGASLITVGEFLDLCVTGIISKY